MVPQRKFRVVVPEGEMDSWQTIQQCSRQLEIAYFCPVCPFYSLYHKLSVKCFRNGNFYGKVCSLLLKDHLHCKHFLQKKSKEALGPGSASFTNVSFPVSSIQDLECEDSPNSRPQPIAAFPRLALWFQRVYLFARQQIWKTLHLQGT